MTKYVLFLGVLLMVLGQAQAANDFGAAHVKGYCDTPPIADDPMIGTIKEDLAYINQTLPNIPLEEDKYLTAESDAAKKIFYEELDGKRSHESSNQRHNALAARHLYYVWIARKDLVKLQDRIDYILNWQSVVKAWAQGQKPVSPAPNIHLNNIYKNEEANKLARAIDVIYDYDSFLMTMNELLIMERFRTDRILSNEQYDNVLYKVLWIGNELERYMQCKLAKTAQTN